MNRLRLWVVVFAVSGAVCNAQQTDKTDPAKAGTPAGAAVAAAGDDAAAKPEIRLTKEQQATLLGDIDATLKFASMDTGLELKRPVKGVFISREELNSQLRKRFDEDEGAKRMERSELVLKKFGLLDRSFVTRPFLLSLLTEQISGFYDNKTHGMNLLDWVPEDQQLPVMAHELTHALQDQRVGLDKWGDTEVKGIAKTVAADNAHIAVDEQDTARDAVLEGGAMVSFADYMLKPMGKTLKDAPEIAERIEQGAGDMSASPVLARAPLVLQQSLVFPYVEGLAFETAVLTAKGTSAAFAKMLDAPPTSTMEILHPEKFLAHATVPVMRMPDLHRTLTAAGYEPYDVGQMGELDVRMTAELFGGRPLAVALAPEWDGGIYLAAQKKSMAGSSDSASLGLLYESRWKNADSARSFFTVFDEEFPRQYDGLSRRRQDEKSNDERVYTTREGDLLLSVKGDLVFVGEGFDVATARKMRDAVEAEQGTGPLKEAREQGTGNREQNRELVGGLMRWMGTFGVMRVALQ